MRFAKTERRILAENVAPERRKSFPQGKAPAQTPKALTFTQFPQGFPQLFCFWGKVLVVNFGKEKATKGFPNAESKRPRGARKIRFFLFTNAFFCATMKSPHKIHTF